MSLACGRRVETVLLAGGLPRESFAWAAHSGFESCRQFGCTDRHYNISVLLDVFLIVELQAGLVA